MISWFKKLLDKFLVTSKKNIYWEKLSKALFVLSISFLLIFIFSQKTDFSNSDLGRHLENGRLVWEQKQILFQNFFSYTEPNHRFINHHWLTGVIFYQIFRLGGFEALSVFNVLLALGIFWIFFYLAYKKSSFFLTGLLSLPVILLMSERVEIRPEMFSVLALGLCWILLESQNFITIKKKILIFMLFAVWSNLHIYFFLGLALLSFYALDDFLKRLPVITWPYKLNQISRTQIIAAWKGSLPFFYILSLSVLASLFNPNHLRGLLYPFNIFRQYGYEIVENKSIFFLQNLVFNYNYTIFKLLLVLLLLVLIVSWVFKPEKKWKIWFFSLFISSLALLASRNLAIFGLVALVIISQSLYAPLVYLYGYLVDKFSTESFFNKISYLSNFVLVFLVVLSYIFLLIDNNGRQIFVSSERGWGVYSGSEDAFNFYKANNLKGPIFNNYDAGSAIIFGLADQEKVFVDNRPEAYSVDFLQNKYLPMQLDGKIWRENWKQYGFKTIIFTHTDGTNWGRQFVIDRLQDPDWALVYFDPFYMILVDKSAYEPEFIEANSLGDWALRQQIRMMADTSYLNIKFHLADFAIAAGQVDIAEEIYKQIILQHPDNFRAPLSLGLLYLNSNDPANLYKGIDYLKQTNKKQKNLPSLFSQMGLAYWRLNDYEEAQKSWEKASRHDKAARDYLKQIKDLKKQGSLPR